MSATSSATGPNWYAIQTLSNQEQKAKRYLDKFIEVEEMEEFVFEILMPTETVTEVKNGKKSTKTRKFYPGYIFVKMRLYDDNGKFCAPEPCLIWIEGKQVRAESEKDFLLTR